MKLFYDLVKKGGGSRRLRGVGNTRYLTTPERLFYTRSMTKRLFKSHHLTISLFYAIHTSALKGCVMSAGFTAQ
ncbi:hypothetical protein ES703_25474 [subsurface metagenome]